MIFAHFFQVISNVLFCAHFQYVKSEVPALQLQKLYTLLQIMFKIITCMYVQYVLDSFLDIAYIYYNIKFRKMLNKGITFGIIGTCEQLCDLILLNRF